MLQKAKTWYVDPTFKMIKNQLFTIHTLVKNNESMIQFPLVFCFMTSRRYRDYAAILEAVSTAFTDTPALLLVVINFEKVTWKAFRNIFSGIDFKGCAFHFCQAV